MNKLNKKTAHSELKSTDLKSRNRHTQYETKRDMLFSSLCRTFLNFDHSFEMGERLAQKLLKQSGTNRSTKFSLHPNYLLNKDAGIFLYSISMLFFLNKEDELRQLAIKSFEYEERLIKGNKLERLQCNAILLMILYTMQVRGKPTTTNRPHINHHNTFILPSVWKRRYKSYLDESLLKLENEIERLKASPSLRTIKNISRHVIVMRRAEQTYQCIRKGLAIISGNTEYQASDNTKTNKLMVCDFDCNNKLSTASEPTPITINADEKRKVRKRNRPDTIADRENDLIHSNTVICFVCLIK